AATRWETDAKYTRFESIRQGVRGRMTGLKRKESFDIATCASLARCLVETIDAAVLVADENGNIMLWNAAAETILGPGPFARLSENWPAQYGFFRSGRDTA